MSEHSGKPLVSVVVVNYNGRHFLHDCFIALFLQTYSSVEVIMVDNASSDGSAEYVRQNFLNIKLLIQDSNLGFAGGVNAGIREAKGEFIFTLNNDTMVFENFIEELVKPMISDPTVGMCASKMLFPDGRINSTGICISRSGAAWDRGMGEPDRGQYDAKEEMFSPCAGAALYRRAMLDEIGLFDEDFFLFMEDVDLAFRARLAGWKCIYTPEARVIHKHGGTTGYQSDLSIYYGNRNILWYVVKNFPIWTFFISSPWIIGRFFGVIPYYFLKGKQKVIVKAKIDALKGLRSMAGKRKTIKKIVSDGEINHWIQTWCRNPAQK